MLFNSLLKPLLKLDLFFFLTQASLIKDLVQVLEVPLKVLVLLAQADENCVHDEEDAHVTDHVREPDEVDDDPRDPR